MKAYPMEELFPSEMGARLLDCPVLVLPFGTLEWHSHHLPLGLDGLVAQGIGERIAGQLGAVLAPVSYWAVGGVPYPYTLDLSLQVIEPLLVSIYEQFGGMGFKLIVAFTGHFGLAQTLAIKRAAVQVMRRSPVTILPVTEYDLVTDLEYTGDHAGPGETSLLWALHPDLVRLRALPQDQPLDGIIGPDPRQSASPERGLEILEAIANRTAEVARRLWQATDAQQRAEYLHALEAGVQVLAETQHRRESMPKASVPSLATSAYLEYCQALYRGDYRRAVASAERKWADLTQ